jgi:hypothetical protein
MHNTFYMVAAMTLYAVVSWFVIAAMIQGVKRVVSNPKFSRAAFISGWLILTLGWIYSATM